MPRRSRLSIPHELHQIKAQQIYQQRIAQGIDGNPEDDWEQARIKIKWWDITAWKIKKLFGAGCRRLWQSFKALINGIGKIITFPLWLFYKLPQLFTNADTKPFALDVVKTIISAASLIAAIIAAIGLFVNYQDALKDRELTQERLVTDRFTKAIEQLGNDKEEVVIGGIYSLERIAKDSPKDQWTIMEVLTAFVRKNSPIPPEIEKLEDLEEKFKALEKLDPVNIQIQAALTVIGRRDPERDYTSDEAPEGNTKRLDLTYSNLRDAILIDANLRYADLSAANLRDADLYRTDFRDADLSGANLRYADLSAADLSDANLSDAILIDANLSAANLSAANLSAANLRYADLYRTDFRYADLSSADFSSADLYGTDFRYADLIDVQNLSNQQIKSACFWEKAIYIDAEQNYRKGKSIAVDEKANQKRITEIKQDKASDPENPPNCSLLK